MILICVDRSVVVYPQRNLCALLSSGALAERLCLLLGTSLPERCDSVERSQSKAGRMIRGVENLCLFGLEKIEGKCDNYLKIPKIFLPRGR